MLARLPAASAALLLVLAGCLGSDDALDPSGGAGGDGPVAAFAITPAATAGTFAFDAGASRGDDLSFVWFFTDGSTGEGEAVEHAFALDNGIVGAVLTVTDAEGRSDGATQGVAVGSGENGPPTVSLTVDRDWVTPGTAVNAVADAQDPEGDDPLVSITTGFLGLSAPPELVEAASASGGDEHAHHAQGGSAAAADNGFDSPEFGQGQTHELTLAEPGIYQYHCHPHPWMTGTVVVADSPAALEGEVTLTAWQVRAFLPATVVVKPGTTLVWDNPDPAPHTVTRSQFIPIAGLGELGTTSAPTLQEAGVHAIVATATDAAGHTASAVKLVKVSADVPERYVNETYAGAINTPADPAAQHSFSVSWPGTANIAFEWNSASPREITDVQLAVYRGNTDGQPMLTTNGPPLAMTLEPGTYVFQVTNGRGLLVDYTVAVEAVLEIEPSFESGGDDHAGHEH